MRIRLDWRFFQQKFRYQEFFQQRYSSLLLACCTLWALAGGISCSEGNIFSPPAQEIPSGEYRGTYSLQRMNPNDKNAKGTNYAEGTMALLINASTRTYRVVSMTDSLTPPASEGTYSLFYTHLTLRDRSNQTFQDPSLVLSGNFVYTFDGTNLVLRQRDTVRNREHHAVLLRL